MSSVLAGLQYNAFVEEPAHYLAEIRQFVSLPALDSPARPKAYASSVGKSNSVELSVGVAVASEEMSTRVKRIGRCQQQCTEQSHG